MTNKQKRRELTALARALNDMRLVQVYNSSTFTNKAYGFAEPDGTFRGIGENLTSTFERVTPRAKYTRREWLIGFRTMREIDKSLGRLLP